MKDVIFKGTSFEDYHEWSRLDKQVFKPLAKQGEEGSFTRIAIPHPQPLSDTERGAVSPSLTAGS
jgi:hypothetical protein